MQDQTSLKIFKIDSDRKISDLHSLCSHQEHFNVFLRHSFDAPVEFILEAYKRSCNYKKTRLKEQTSYFMCLISGETKLEKAISAQGFGPDDKSSILITDSDDVIKDLIKTGVSVNEYVTERKDEKRLYGEMTLVELELIKPDGT